MNRNYDGSLGQKHLKEEHGSESKRKIEKVGHDSKSKDEFLIYIGNVNTSQLENKNVNALFNQFSCLNKEIEIEFIRVFKDAIYAGFSNEQDARKASRFFNHFKFNQATLVSFYVERPVVAIASELSKDKYEDEDFDSTNFKKLKSTDKFNFKKIECEIVVFNRSLK